MFIKVLIITEKNLSNPYAHQQNELNKLYYEIINNHLKNKVGLI